MTDDEVIAAVLSGKSHSFRVIVERYKNMVFSIGMRFFHNEEDALEYSQDVFVRAYERLDMFSGKGQFKYWLSKLAYNHGINKIKSLKKDEPLEYPDLERSGEKAVSKILENNEIKTVLAGAVSELPEEYRVCVEMYFFGGLSHQQISEITDIPVGTIKSNVHRAKNILRNSLRGTVAEDYNEM